MVYTSLTYAMPIHVFVLLMAIVASAGESAECHRGIADSCDHDDQFSALQQRSSVQFAAEELQAAAVICPHGSIQVGGNGADISGCGLTGCFDRNRYGLSNVDACLARCKGNSKCKAFTWSQDGTYAFIKVSVCTLYDSTESNRQSWGKVILCKMGSETPVPTPQPTPKPTPNPTPKPTPKQATGKPSAEALAISGIRLEDDLAVFKKKQRTSEYRLHNDEVVARRCSSFSVVLTHSAAGLIQSDDSEMDLDGVVGQPALLLQRFRRQDHPKDKDTVDVNTPEAAALAQRKSLSADLAASQAAVGPGKMKCTNGKNCGEKLSSLYLRRNKLDLGCGFPENIPSSAIVDRFFCSLSNATCTKQRKKALECLIQRQPLERQIEACQACILKKKNAASFVESESVVDQIQDAFEEGNSAKEEAWREVQDEERMAAKQRWLDMREDLFNWQGAPRPSTETDVELVEEVSGHAETSTPRWPSVGSLVFKGAGGLSVHVEAARTKTDCGTTCTYRVDLPCDMPVGTGRVCSKGSNGKSVCGNKIHVVFNPYASSDEVFMSPDDFSEEDYDTFLKQETAGFWTGTANDNGAFTWAVDQFDVMIFDAAMKMVSMIPLEQRGSAPRVARWLVFLIGEEVLWGRWCSEDGCYDDGTEPGVWEGSKKIYTQWLKTGKAVKYGQCWVFAGTTLSATRALGFGSRQISNFNSAHGHPPYNKGVDDFFTYDKNSDPTIIHANHKARPESIWNFHAWNEVYMKRNDLVDVDADGWQVIDATPQERSCEKHDGAEKICRYMVGPASKRAMRNHAFETQGGQTKYHAINAGLSYDSMFTFGETDGDWRGWRPKQTDFSRCDKKCTADFRGDGYCDWECNNADCDWDMGDCCAESCEDKEGKHTVKIYRKYKCGHKSPYDCKNKNAQGWELEYNNSLHVGTQISTQRSGESHFALNDVTHEYKISQ